MYLPRLRWRLSTLFVLLTVSAVLIYVNSRPSPQTLGWYLPDDPEPGPDWPVFGSLYGWPWAFLTSPEPAYHRGAEVVFRHFFWKGAALDALVALALIGAAVAAWEGLLRVLRKSNRGH